MNVYTSAAEMFGDLVIGNTGCSEVPSNPSDPFDGLFLKEFVFYPMALTERWEVFYFGLPGRLMVVLYYVSFVFVYVSWIFTEKTFFRS